MRGILSTAIVLGMLACRSSEKPTEPLKTEPVQAAVQPTKEVAKPHEFLLPTLRKDFKTSFVTPATAEERKFPVDPPPGIFERVMYPAPLGENAAYVSPIKLGEKRPAIVWIAGGMSWDIGDSAWKEAPRYNDQSARQYRDAGIVLMLPSLRGTHTNPGRPEFFLGEVDDVLAAAEFLAKRADVDPKRIYLGGHSTGATMALLAAESSARFRAVFAFGPVGHVGGYGEDWAVFDTKNEKEWMIRSPVFFIDTIASPTFVIEGHMGNVDQFPRLRRRVKNAPVKFVPVLGANHFNVLAPMSELVAKKILADTGPECAISFSDAEVDEIAINQVEWREEQ